MTKPLQRAMSLLERGYTCVICDHDRVLTSKKTGIAPLLERWESGEALHDVSVADRIVGKAAAMLLLLMGAAEVYGSVMSEPARQLLTEAGVSVSYGELVPVIVNRKGDGPCPMEQTVAGLTAPADAPAALRQKLDALRKGIQ